MVGVCCGYNQILIQGYNKVNIKREMGFGFTKKKQLTSKTYMLHLSKLNANHYKNNVRWYTRFIFYDF